VFLKSSRKTVVRNWSVTNLCLLIDGKRIRLWLQYSQYRDSILAEEDIFEWVPRMQDPYGSTVFLGARIVKAFLVAEGIQYQLHNKISLMWIIKFTFIWILIIVFTHRTISTITPCTCTCARHATWIPPWAEVRLTVSVDHKEQLVGCGVLTPSHTLLERGYQPSSPKLFDQCQSDNLPSWCVSLINFVLEACYHPLLNLMKIAHIDIRYQNSTSYIHICSRQTFHILHSALQGHQTSDQVVVILLNVKDSLLSLLVKCACCIATS
jgi:hypothetical protein